MTSTNETNRRNQFTRYVLERRSKAIPKKTRNTPLRINERGEKKQQRKMAPKTGNNSAVKSHRRNTEYLTNKQKWKSSNDTKRTFKCAAYAASQVCFLSKCVPFFPPVSLPLFGSGGKEKTECGKGENSSGPYVTS